MLDKRFIIGEIKELGELYQTLIDKQSASAHYLVAHMLEKDPNYQNVFGQLRSQCGLIQSYYSFLTELHNHLDELHQDQDLKLESLVELERIMKMAVELKGEFQSILSRSSGTQKEDQPSVSPISLSTN